MGQNENYIMYKHLQAGLMEHYQNCQSPLKNEKCTCFDDPADIPCKCQNIIAIRKQVKWLEEVIRP